MRLRPAATLVAVALCLTGGTAVGAASGTAVAAGRTPSAVPAPTPGSHVRPFPAGFYAPVASTNWTLDVAATNYAADEVLHGWNQFTPAARAGHHYVMVTVHGHLRHGARQPLLGAVTFELYGDTSLTRYPMVPVPSPHALLFARSVAAGEYVSGTIVFEVKNRDVRAVLLKASSVAGSSWHYWATKLWTTPHND